MSPTLTTFLFEAANFLVLAAVLGWLFFNPVRQALNQRRDKLQTDARQAAEQLAEAEKARREVAAARENLQAELNEMRQRQLEATRKQAEQLLSDARAVAAQEREKGRLEAARITDAQRDSLAQSAAAAAAEVVAELLEQIADFGLQTALVRSACGRLADLPQDVLPPVRVESAQPLAADQRAALDQALGPAAAAAVYQINEQLGCGLRISTGSGLVDATSHGLIQHARNSLTYELQRLANHHNPLQGANDV